MRAGGRRVALGVACAVAAALLGACAVGPDYHRPELHATAAYKENAGWQTATPADELKRGAWWELFGDPLLNDLQRQVDDANQSIKQAEAQYRQAAALVSGARASLWPTVSTSLTATRSGRYGNSGGGIVSGGTVIGSGEIGSPGSSHPTNSYQLPISATWEPDLWGSVRRQVEASASNAQASAATLESTRLSLHAQLASTYFQLRIVDEQKRLLDGTVAAYQKALQLTQNQYNVGIVARADVITADTQLKGAQVQAIDLGLARAQFEHAIAVLVGKMPAQFSVPAQALTVTPPAIPVDVPATLLERRPDVAIAERQAAAANAQIGIAEAAWFPTLTLSAGGGYQNSVWSQLLEAPSRYWSIGPRLAEVLFDGGARRAQNAQARAAYDAAAANYRQVALTAFQNVEDNLSGLRILAQEATAQDDAVKSAERALAITTNQYRAGTVSYLNVITAQATAYSNERNAITILGNRLEDSVQLIKALGGGWTQGELPVARQIDLHSRPPDPAPR